MAAIKAIRLARLPVGWKDQPQLLERYWDESMTAIEKSLNAILQIPAIQEALANVNTAVQEAKSAAQDAKDAADAAQISATSAGGTADSAAAAVAATAKETSLNQSYPSGYTGNLLTGSSSGAVTIKAHTRTYGDPVLNPPVAVDGATIATGGSPGDVVRFYYIDTTRSGGAVSYQFTTDPDPAMAQTGDVHSVGAVEIPTSGTSPGKGVRPPGYVSLE